MNYSEALTYLYGLGHEVLTAKFDLENERQLLERLGNPHKNFKSLIVAGTNGKGSTASMIEAIVRAAGYKTALYTSPHLVRVEERIRLAGNQISEEDFARHATEVRSAAETLVSGGSLPAIPTFFEQLTAIALHFFGEQRPDLALLEVGLGGRLDATSVAESIVAVITAIGYDHQEILGSTIEQIAAEKAAVIKPGMRAAVARQPYRVAGDVIMRYCLDARVLPAFANEPFVETDRKGTLTIDYDLPDGETIHTTLNLRGRHQADNAATSIEAAAILRDLGFEIDKDAIERGLGDVSWPGRLEIVDERPVILLDGAHNIDGARTLRTFLDEFWSGPLTLVFGAMNDKDLEGIAAELFGVARTLVITRVRDKRAATGAAIGTHAIDGWHNVVFTENVGQAMSWARSLTPPDGMICVAGSLHLVGEVKQLLEQEDGQQTFLRPDGTS